MEQNMHTLGGINTYEATVLLPCDMILHSFLASEWELVHEVFGNEFDPAAMRRLCCLFWLMEEDVGGPIVATGLMARDYWRWHVM